PSVIAVTEPADSIRAVLAQSVAGLPRDRQVAFDNFAKLLSAIAVVLMGVACANLGGLLLARGLARRREIALRTALGAGRGRVARQLLAESAVIAGMGAAIG